MYETLGSGPEFEERIDTAALAILFAVVESQLAEGVSVTAESNFDAEFDIARFRRLADELDVEIVPARRGRHARRRGADRRARAGGAGRPRLVS